LQSGARLTNNLGLRLDEIQRVRIIVSKIIIWRLTS
jgi:hypothetical protein